MYKPLSVICMEKQYESLLSDQLSDIIEMDREMEERDRMKRRLVFGKCRDQNAPLIHETVGHGFSFRRVRQFS